jgi:hypothetical protein
MNLRLRVRAEVVEPIFGPRVLNGFGLTGVLAIYR